MEFLPVPIAYIQSATKIPIWIANYVLDNYGTGVVMGVPAHDARDYDFAKKFRIEIIEVIHNPEESTHLPYLASGILKNSYEFDNMDSGEAKKISEYCIKNNIGEEATTYRLRDWGISRQRYWGSPIPVFASKMVQFTPYLKKTCL